MENGHALSHTHSDNSRTSVRHRILHWPDLPCARLKGNRHSHGSCVARWQACPGCDCNGGPISFGSCENGRTNAQAINIAENCKRLRWPLPIRVLACREVPHSAL